jgi:hypothetical protein
MCCFHGIDADGPTMVYEGCTFCEACVLAMLQQDAAKLQSKDEEVD